MNAALGCLLFLILAPVAGALLAGLDRVASARMQRRQGPPLWQPVYDLQKLFGKQGAQVNIWQGVYAGGFLLFTMLAGGIFFAGGDLLLSVFALSVAGVLLALAASSAGSPYAHLGAQRELLQMLAYEPMLLLTAVGLETVCGSFRVSRIAQSAVAPLLLLPGVFAGFLFILSVKFRKSPFDLAGSHHAHQELVRGVTVELSGAELALVELGHWYESIFLLGMVWLFMAPLGWRWAFAGTALAYTLEILADNSSARLRWETLLRGAWTAALLLGGVNILVVHAFLRSRP